MCIYFSYIYTGWGGNREKLCEEQKRYNALLLFSICFCFCFFVLHSAFWLVGGERERGDIHVKR
jgi:hypothetical protein